MEQNLTADDLIIPANGYTQNEGLWKAQRGIGEHTFDVEEFIGDVVAGITSLDMEGGKFTSPHHRDYITDPSDHEIEVIGAPKGNGKKNAPTDPIGPANCTTFSAACLEPNAVNYVSCIGTDLNIPAEVFDNVVVVTECNLNFANGTELKNATFITKSTDDDSIKSPQGLDLGDMQNCGDTGGAALITYGSMKSAAKMRLLGGQIIAAGDVNFAAQADGFKGASVIAGGEIDGTSNSSFEGCPGVVLHNFFPTTSPPARLAG